MNILFAYFTPFDLNGGVISRLNLEVFTSLLQAAYYKLTLAWVINVRGEVQTQKGIGKSSASV